MKFNIPTTTPRDNFAILRVCNAIKYHLYACHFLIAPFSIWKYFIWNAAREPRPMCQKKWPPERYGVYFRRSKKGAKTQSTHTHTNVLMICPFIPLFLLNYVFSFISSARNFKTFHLRVESAGYSREIFFSISPSRKPVGIVPYGPPSGWKWELEIDFFARN